MPRLSENALSYTMGDYGSVGTSGQVGANTTAIASVFNPTIDAGLAAGDVLAYIKKTGDDEAKWQSTALKLGGLSNVVITGSTSGHTLKYDSSTGRWIDVAVVESFTKAQVDAAFLADATRESQVIAISDNAVTSRLAYVSGGKLYTITGTLVNN